jgi:putative transposase
VKHEKVHRLMREHALQPRARRRHVATTDSDHDGLIFPDLAKDVARNGPYQLWVADLTYAAVLGSFGYAAVFLDAWSRRVVGHAIGRLASPSHDKPPGWTVRHRCPMRRSRSQRGRNRHG